jgi:hypothetical protein
MFVGYRIAANAYGKLFVSDLCRNAEQCCDHEVFCDVVGNLDRPRYYLSV